MGKVAKGFSPWHRLLFCKAGSPGFGLVLAQAQGCTLPSSPTMILDWTSSPLNEWKKRRKKACPIPLLLTIHIKDPWGSWRSKKSRTIFPGCLVKIGNPYFITKGPHTLVAGLGSMIDWLTDWLMITYIALFSALLSRLTALACGSTWVTSFFIARFFEYPPKWWTYSADMAGATWNCSHLGTSSVYAIQPCTMSLHAKPHT